MTPILRALATLAAVLLAGCQSAFYAGVNLLADDSGVVERRGVEFDPSHGLALDVYTPRQAPADAPVVVFFYGGSWRSGERGWLAFVGRALARHGAIVVIPDYRKAPESGFPDFVQDAARAVAWTFEQAAALGGDRERVHLMGHSAGGHIAALLGTDGRYLAELGLAPTDLASVIGLAGAYDFLPLTSRRLAEVFGPVEDHADSQPVHFVDGDEPPFLLLQGLDDSVVIPRNARRLAALLAAQGSAVELREYPDLGHPGILIALARPGRTEAPVLADVVRHLQVAGNGSSAVAKGR